MKEIIGSLYTEVSDRFQKGIIGGGGIARTIKAEKHDLGVVEVKVKVIGQMDNTMDHTFESANRVYDVSGISPTINTCGGGGLQPKIIERNLKMEGKNFNQSDVVHTENWICRTIIGQGHSGNEPKILEVKQLGFMDNGTGKHQRNTVYDENAVCSNITTIEGGETQQITILNQQTIVAMRGRNPDNPSDRSVGIHTEQRLEQNSQGICNTLTSVQKDNLVMETIKIKQATKDGYIECKVGGVADLSFPSSTTRRGRVQDNGDTCPTLMSGESDICKIESLYRIRKLTPRECWRLMDFSDEDFEKAAEVNSNTQLYKQAGNSIVRNVLVAIIGQMIPGKEDVYKNI